MKKITFILLLSMFIASAFAQTMEKAPFAGNNNFKANTNPWTVQFSLAIPSTIAAGTYGIESDGTNLFVSKFNSSYFYHFNMSGTLLDSFAISGVTNVRDLAYDGTYFYGGANSNVIYKMDFTAHTLVSSITLPSGFLVRHIAYDPTANSGAGGLWCGPWNTMGPRLYSLTGTFIDSIPAANLGTYSAAGSAYDNVTPGGPYLWLYSQSTNYHDIIQVNIATKQKTGLIHDLTVDIPTLAGGSMAGGLFQRTNLISGTTTLAGLAQGTLIWGIDLASTMPLPRGAKITTLNLQNYIVNNAAQALSGVLTNIGDTTITSLDLNYTINGGTPITQTISGLNVTSYGTYNFTPSTPWTPTAVGAYTVQLWASNINGDATFSSDTITKLTNVVSSIPTKRVFCEEATGTWCGWCVRGIVNMDLMATNHPTDWVGIAVHNGDPMVVSAWDTGLGTFPGFSGFPSIIVDRTILEDPGNAATAYTTQKAVVSPVDVAIANVTYSGGVISFDVKATPVTTGTVNWTINGAVYEMNVTWKNDAAPTTDSASYEQHNYYAGGSYGAMGGFESLASVIPANSIHFDFVNRALLGGYTGTAGSIPASIVDGTTYTKTYTYTVPSYEKSYDMHLVGFVIDQATGKVLNSIQVPLSATGIQENNSTESIKMYPNPSNGMVNISGLTGKSLITVTNLFGETVKYVENTKVVDLSNFANGIYFVRVNSNNHIVTEKIILNK